MFLVFLIIFIFVINIVHYDSVVNDFLHNSVFDYKMAYHTGMDIDPMYFSLFKMEERSAVRTRKYGLMDGNIDNCEVS